jgi:glucan phosphoethanolaminetransferase (alkaline phosphatase superfamily)
LDLAAAGRERDRFRTAAQTHEPGAGMRAISLLAVFVLAKLLVLWGRDVPASPWAVPAFFWQDVVVATFYGLVDYGFRRHSWVGRCLYTAIILYTAINVPVACILSTPLTWPMLRATRGALVDSILYYVTPLNIVRMAAVLGTGLIVPVLLDRLRDRMASRARVTAVVASLCCILLGPTAARQIPTLGLDRNVLGVLISTALPRINASEEAGDWRSSPFGDRCGEDLSRFHGSAAGRNVVMIHLESTGARYLRPYGAAEDPTPNLTALTRAAILFDNAYTTYPETIRSFLAVQNSLYPALDAGPEVYEHPASPGLAALLRSAGYRTGLFHSGRFRYLGMESVIRNRGYEALEDAGAIGGDRESSFGIDEESTVRRILAWIDAGQRDQPFFVSYLPIAGHHPYATPAPGPLSEANDIDRYRNALHYSDEAFGQLLQGLRQRGLYEKTLFVILGDHGEAFGQHEGNFGHTLFIYEENVRVPLVFAAPGLFRSPLCVPQVASLLDVGPTTLDVLGLRVPSAYHGRSLLSGQFGMALFCTDYSLGLLGLRDGRWKFILELESDRPLLFDLETDPDERSDVSSLYPERVEAYRDHLRRWAAHHKYLVSQSR